MSRSVPSLWTKHRPLARRISRDFRIPGNEPQDTEQEALVALWEAARTYDPEKGATFPTWAGVVIRRHLTDLLRTATREKRGGPTVELEDVAAADETAGRAQLQLCLERLPSLTQAERSAIAGKLNGTYDSHDKAQDNALTAARRKLRAA